MPRPQSTLLVTSLNEMHPIISKTIEWIGRYSHPVTFGDRVRFRKREWLLATKLDLYLIGWGCPRHPFPTPEALDRWLVSVSTLGGNPPLPATFIAEYNCQQNPTDCAKPIDRQPDRRYPLISLDNEDVIWAELDELQFVAAGRYLDLRDNENRVIAIPSDLVKRIKSRSDCGLYQVIFMGGAELWINRTVPSGLHWTPYTEEAIAALDALMGDRGQRVLAAG